MGTCWLLGISSVLLNLYVTISHLPMTSAKLHQVRPIKSLELEATIERHLAEVEMVSPIYMMIQPRVDPAILQLLLSKYISTHPVYLAKKDDRPFINSCISPICSKLLSVVGIFETLEDIRPSEWITLYNSTWNPRSKIAIWVTKPPTTTAIENTLKEFWSLDSLNVILPVINQSSNVTVYSYDPFYRTNDDQVIRGKLYKSWDFQELYPDKMRNIQRYPISVSIYDPISPEIVTRIDQLGPNSDIKILKILSSWLNFTINLKGRPISLAEYYSRLSLNEVKSGPVHDLITNRSEILGNSQLLEVVDHRVEFVEPYSRWYSRVVLPRPKMIPGLKRVFRSISNYTWILLISFSISPAIYMYCRGTDGPIINTFRLIIHQQFYAVGSRLSERIFAISWILFAFFFVLLEQVHLVQDMTDPPFYRGMNTLKELADSDITIMTDPYQFLGLNQSQDDFKRKIASRVQVESNYIICSKKLIRGENIACITDTSVLLDKKLDSQGSTRILGPHFVLHIMREVVGAYWRTMLVKKGFPYLPKFNDGLRRLRESGLIIKWTTRDVESFNRKFIPNDEVRPLNLSHFDGPLKLFLLGMGIAICCFIYEIVFWRVKKKWPSVRRILYY